MNIAILVKQVPGTTNVEIDPVTGTLKRDGVAAKMNPYDLFSLETAILLKEKYGGTITAITMGPPQAGSVIREAVYMGCDRGFVLSDRKFAGADVLATSRTISQGVKMVAKKLGLASFNLILCGKQTTDGDTAQVGPETAEWLALPHVANVREIHEVRDGKVLLTADMGEYVETVELPLPAVLTIEKDVNSPRLPSIKRKYELEGKEDPVGIITFADYEDQNEKHYGLSGSPTRVERIFPPDTNNDKQMYTGPVSELADALIAELRNEKRI